jgi:hypothetical protein
MHSGLLHLIECPHTANRHDVQSKYHDKRAGKARGWLLLIRIVKCGLGYGTPCCGCGLKAPGLGSPLLFRRGNAELSESFK